VEKYAVTDAIKCERGVSFTRQTRRYITYGGIKHFEEFGPKPAAR